MVDLIELLLTEVILPRGVHHNDHVSKEFLERFISTATNDEKMVRGKIKAVMEQFDVFKLLLDGANAMLRMKSRVEEISGKFGALVLGDATIFFNGLTGLIGEPDFLDLEEAVRREHESTVKFTTKNYNITTSPLAEWKLTFGGCDELPRGKREDGPDLGMRKHVPPTELLKDLHTLIKECFENDPDLKKFASNVTEKAVQEIHLLPVEVGCLRMYTGDSRISFSLFLSFSLSISLSISTSVYLSLSLLDLFISLAFPNCSFLQVPCFRSTMVPFEVVLTVQDTRRPHI